MRTGEGERVWEGVGIVVRVREAGEAMHETKAWKRSGKSKRRDGNVV